jgi:hypothetical protein
MDAAADDSTEGMLGFAPRRFSRGMQRAVSWTRHLPLVIVVLGALVQWPAGGRASPPLSPDDRDALGRLAYAEAGDQGEEGLAAVIFAVLNRLASGRFGADVTAVIEAAGQFEPVDRAGGHWRRLPPLTATQRATIETIIGLIQQGRLPDPTHGATSFQNPGIVAAREAAGQVRAGLTDFGHQMPIAIVRDHAFFGSSRQGDAPVETGAPQAHLVYPPGVTPGFQVERVDAGTPANPHAVIYRIVPSPARPRTEQ